MKLIDIKVDFIRLGGSDKVDPSLISYHQAMSRDTLKTVDELLSLYEKKTLVVGTTCLSMKQ
jgi:hypothetical protein